MLSNVTHSHFYFECNKERGPIDQLYIELGKNVYFSHFYDATNIFKHVQLFFAHEKLLA